MSSSFSVALSPSCTSSVFTASATAAGTVVAAGSRSFRRQANSRSRASLLSSRHRSQRERESETREAYDPSSLLLRLHDLVVSAQHWLERVEALIERGPLVELLYLRLGYLRERSVNASDGPSTENNNNKERKKKKERLSLEKTPRTHTLTIGARTSAHNHKKWLPYVYQQLQQDLARLAASPAVLELILSECCAAASLILPQTAPSASWIDRAQRSRPVLREISVLAVVRFLRALSIYRAAARDAHTPTRAFLDPATLHDFSQLIKVEEKRISAWSSSLFERKLIAQVAAASLDSLERRIKQIPLSKNYASSTREWFVTHERISAEVQAARANGVIIHELKVSRWILSRLPNPLKAEQTLKASEDAADALALSLSPIPRTPREASENKDLKRLSLSFLKRDSVDTAETATPRNSLPRDWRTSHPQPAAHGLHDYTRNSFRRRINNSLSISASFSRSQDSQIDSSPAVTSPYYKSANSSGNNNNPLPWTVKSPRL